VLHPDFCDAKL